jgi:hypothetical protein
MNIEFHLIDIRSPRGFEVVVPHNRWRQVLPEHNMSVVVDNLIAACGRNRLDVLRIEAHGVVSGEMSAIVDTIQLGSDMNSSTVLQFQRIRSLWSCPYQAPMLGTYYPGVRRRIEMHCCELVPGCNSTLQALANAARAPVFATSASGDVNASAGGDPYALAEPVYRFNPPWPGPLQPSGDLPPHLR